MKDEEKLIRKSQGGDERAFGELYDIYISKIYRFIFFRVGRQKEDTEDITHQVFMSAWQNMSKYESRGLPFSSWLYRIASNAVIDYYRTHRSHIDIDTVPEEMVVELSNATTELDSQLNMSYIHVALAKLEPEQQNVLIMRFIEDLSTKEIAIALEKSEGAIRVIQHRALKQLKHYVDETKPNNPTTQEV